MPGRLLVISGPSGSGKSTIVRSLLEHPGIRFSVSATTRSPRPGEVDGVHYRFVDIRQFEAMIRAGELLEWAEYNDNYYGTPSEPVDQALDAGHDVLLEIEIQGARQIRASRPQALMFFIVPPTMKELEMRLVKRGDTSGPDIAERLRIAESEIAEAPGLFDHIVVNSDLDEAVGEILSLITA